MSKKKNTIIIAIAAILLVLIIVLLFLYNKGIGLQKINYDELNELMENKESFVLCISRTTCEHCDDFKPKLDNVAKDNFIKIYYIDIDKESEENQEKFREIITFNGKTPTTIFIKDGVEATTANRISGSVSEKKVIEKLKANDFID